MTQVDVHDASGTLPDLIRRVRAGEEVLLTQDGKPAVRLVPVEPVRRQLFGLLKGEFEIADDFDAPLPEDVLEEWGL